MDWGGEFRGFEWADLVFAFPFLIGIASGGQSIYAKLGGEWLQVLKTLAGWFYWASRGVVPTICYVALFATKLNFNHSISTAVICGLGAEAVLRSRFFIGSKTSGGKTEEIYKGVFDLVEWYQNLLLRMASDNLASSRLALVNRLLGSTIDFPALCAKASANANGFQVSGPALQEIITAKREAFAQEPNISAGTASEKLHRTYALELGYALLKEVGRKHLETLLS